MELKREEPRQVGLFVTISVFMFSQEVKRPRSDQLISYHLLEFQYP